MSKSIALALLHQGLVRNHNEDNLFLLDSAVQPAKSTNFERAAASEDSLQFYAVADGMGGGGIGDLAAQTIMRVLDQQRRRLRSSGRFDFSSFARDLIELGNRSVCEQLSAWRGLPVGTTFSLLAIDRDNAYTLSFGNSRIYLYRDNQLHQLTEDHISYLPDRRQVTRYFGFMNEDAKLETDNMTRLVLSRGDVLLLTTDGITDNLDNEQIAAVLAMPIAFVQQIRQLRDLALKKGGRDNLSLIGVKIQEPLAVARPEGTKRTEHPAVGYSAGGGPRLHDTGRQQVPGKINQSGQVYSGPIIKSSPGYLQSNRQRRWLRPLLFFLFFILLGILLGKLLFSLPVWLKTLFAS